MDPDESNILLDSEQRIVKQITVKDVDAAETLFDDLFGTAVVPRKKYIQNHSSEAQIDF